MPTFADIPNSREEAERMISLGILPTHTIMLNIKGNTGKSNLNIIILYVMKIKTKLSRFQSRTEIK